MRLHIDWTRCDGRGLCIELLPEVLMEDDWAYPLVRNGPSDPIEIPEALEPHARQAIVQCPRAAIRRCD